MRHSWPAPTPSLLLLFDETSFGSEILTGDGSPLHPGDLDRSVRLYFWDPEVRYYIRPDSSFLLTYNDRIIGDGSIEELIEDRPLSPHPPGWQKPYGAPSEPLTTDPDQVAE